MRSLSLFFTLLIAALLVSCGGGGGSPGLPISGSGATPLSVAAPTTVTLSVGSTQQYTIAGGVAPYSVFSSNPAVVAGWLIGSNVVAVGVVSSGVGVVTVQDSKGTQFNITVTGGSSTKFSTNAPLALTLSPGPFGSQTYKLSGGVPPYTAVSTFPAVVSAVVNGTDVTITALQLPGQSTVNSGVGVSLSDSASPPTVIPIAVTLGTLPLAINPTTLTAPIGTVFRAVITGGTPPYRFVVLDQCATNVQLINGNMLQATVSGGCTGAAITVFDANNQTPVTPLTFQPATGTLGLQVSPTTFTVPESATTPNLNLTVYGVSAGPVQVFSTDTSILAPQTPVKNADGTYSITLTGGNTCSLAVTPGQPAGTPVFTPPIPATGGDRTITITVLDGTGRQGTSTIKVQDTNQVAGCS